MGGFIDDPPQKPSRLRAARKKLEPLRANPKLCKSAMMLFFLIILGQELHLHALVVAIWWQQQSLSTAGTNLQLAITSYHLETVAPCVQLATTCLNVLALCFYLSNCYGTKCARNVPPAQRCQITGLPSQKIVSCKMSEGPPTCNTMRRIEEAASLSQVAAIVTRRMDGRSGRWQDHNWTGEHFQLFNISFSSLGRNKY